MYKYSDDESSKFCNKFTDNDYILLKTKGHFITKCKFIQQTQNAFLFLRQYLHLENACHTRVP